MLEKRIESQEVKDNAAAVQGCKQIMNIPAYLPSEAAEAMESCLGTDTW